MADVTVAILNEWGRDDSEPDWVRDEGGTAEPVFPFRRYTTRELLDADRSFKWTVRGMLVSPTFGMIGAPRKTLKSTVADFIHLGITTGVPIFDHFQVEEMGAVLVYVGEGGRVPYTRRLERVAAAMGIGSYLADVPLHVSFDVAPIGSERFFGSLRRDLTELEPVLFHLDPFYAYHPSAVNGSNLFEEGAMLATLSGQCLAAGASCLVTSHFNKTGIGSGLDRITQAGGQEWSDSWLLLSHRSDPDVAHGLFRLTLEIGSRQWGGSAWDLDLDLGRFDEEQGEFEGSITWDLHRAGSVAGSSREQVVSIVTAQPWQLSREALAKSLGGNLVTARHVVDDALARGDIAVSEIRAMRSNGRQGQRITVYGPTNLRPTETGLDAGSENVAFPLLNGTGTHVQGSDVG